MCAPAQTREVCALLGGRLPLQQNQSRTTCRTLIADGRKNQTHWHGSSRCRNSRLETPSVPISMLPSGNQFTHRDCLSHAILTNHEADHTHAACLQQQRLPAPSRHQDCPTYLAKPSGHPNRRRHPFPPLSSPAHTNQRQPRSCPQRGSTSRRTLATRCFI